jgi:hypothetical protein
MTVSRRRHHRSGRVFVREFVWTLVLLAAAAGVTLAVNPLPTGRLDFFVPGTQPNPSYSQDGPWNPTIEPLINPLQCSFCHESPPEAPFAKWPSSMHGQSARDPVFHAALSIAEQDAPFIGEACWRCHAPTAWLSNHVQDTTGADLQSADFQGVSCSTCHRSVDPIYTLGQSPAPDKGIILALSPPPLADAHDGSMVIDPLDRRRGPLDLEADWLVINPPSPENPGGWPGFHEWLKSPFHTSSRMCATCHDVSLPHFTKQVDGTYALNTPNTPGPGSKHDMFPEQRTYSEWTQSLFAQAPVNLNGRFGGSRGSVVSSCQDCHMPGESGHACALEPPLRPAVPQHGFAGSNSWVMKAVRAMNYDSETYLSEEAVDAHDARNRDLMERASDLELAVIGRQLKVRVTNFTGHKLPTGYAEGRAMWINVEFKNLAGQTVTQLGAFDPATGGFSRVGTKVYEAVFGLDAALAAFTGRPEGPAFRLALANKIYKDNRIPPMGFTNAGLASVSSSNVPAGLYPDGQYWDDTFFEIPRNTRSIAVKVLHQTSTKEYMEFLRDNDTTPRLANLPPIPPEFGPANQTSGQLAYNLWLAFGKSAPIVMDNASIPVVCKPDFNADGVLTPSDIFAFVNAYFARQPAADFNPDGSFTPADIFGFLNGYFAGC